MEKRKTFPNKRQRKAVEAMLDGTSASQAMIKAGYSPASAKNPSVLTKSLGFQDLIESLGLTDNFLTSALVEDIAAKPGNRKAELELGFKVRGRLKEQDGGNKTVVVLVSGQTNSRYENPNGHGVISGPSTDS